MKIPDILYLQSVKYMQLLSMELNNAEYNNKAEILDLKAIQSTVLTFIGVLMATLGITVK